MKQVKAVTGHWEDTDLLLCSSEDLNPHGRAAKAMSEAIPNNGHT